MIRAVDPEVERLRLVELEEFRHQADEAGLRLGPGGWQGRDAGGLGHQWVLWARGFRAFCLQISIGAETGRLQVGDRPRRAKRALDCGLLAEALIAIAPVGWTSP